ncbi:MAG: GGDEF domain-containing protein [Pseudomonadota bacterium]
MVLQVPSKPLSLLVVSRDRNDANILDMGLRDSMGTSLSRIDLESDPQAAAELYKRIHSDVVVISGFSSGYSEALVLHIRKIDGKRHAGIIVMATINKGFDELAINNYNAGADDVISTRTSAAILKLKITTVFNHKLAADDLRASVHKLQVMNQTDELTGLANMRGFLKKFAMALKENQEGTSGLAVIMIDLDHFKRVNDTMNHMVGSFIIKSVGHILGDNKFFESTDFAARYGGDEYIIVLRGMDPLVMMSKVDNVRRIIEGKLFDFQEHSVRVTCSMGLCWVPPKFSGRPEDVVKCADAMLYKSKEAGRNTLTGMTLRYPIDFNHIGGTHLIDWDAGSDDNRVARHDKA